MTEVITPAMPEQHVTRDALCPDDLPKALVNRGFYIFDRPSALQVASPGRRCQLGHRGSTEPLSGQVQAIPIAGGSYEAA
jgi:hypothetical protein